MTYMYIHIHKTDDTEQIKNGLKSYTLMIIGRNTSHFWFWDVI